MMFLEYVYGEVCRSMDEALKKKFVVRNGKRVAKWKTTRQGKYRVEYDANGTPKEVRITAKERINRKKGQRKGKIKRKAKESTIEMKRKRSFIARKNVGLSYNKELPDVNSERDKALTKFKRAPKDLDNLKLPGIRMESYRGENDQK